jgi:hypothetical protein
LTTAGRYKDEIDLTYILFDNESNKSTGGQNSYQNHIDYIAIAKASGLNVDLQTITTLDAFSATIESSKGLQFLHIKCGLDEETPRPPIEIVKVSHFQ